MVHQSFLYQLPNNRSVWAAIALAIPVYFIAFLGPSPFIQGLAYLTYPAALLGWYLSCPSVKVSRYFLMTLTVFLALWITPSMVNLYGGTLESDAINIPVISYHFVMLPIVLAWLYLWQKGISEQEWLGFGRHLCILITPIFIILILKILMGTYVEGKEHAWGFTYRHLDAEMFLLWAILAYFMKNGWLKLIITSVALMAMVWMSVRGGLLAAILFIVLAYGVPKLKNIHVNRKVLLSLAGGALVVLLFHAQLYGWLDQILYLENPSRGFGSGITQRTEVWQVAWENIMAHPWSGIGYYVRPNPFNDPYNAAIQVHNLFLRIWVENGTPLFLFVVALLVATAWQIEKHKLTWERAAFWSILCYYFFIPRHIQLNPMTIILYLIVIRSLIYTGVDKKGKAMSNV